MDKKRIYTALLILIFSISIFGSFTAAVVCHREYDNSYKYLYRLPEGMAGSDKDRYNELTTFKMGTRRAFCINPYVLSEDGIDYGEGSASFSIIPSDYHRLTLAKQKRIELAWVYGWELSAQAKRDALYMKILVGELATDQKTKEVVGSAVSLSDYEKWKTEINRRIDSYLNDDPSFHKSSVDIVQGSKIVIEDAKAVLNEYSLTSIPAGITATLTGNLLELKAAPDFSGGQLKLQRLKPYQGESRYFYLVLPNGNKRQPLIAPGIPAPKEAVLELRGLQTKGNFRLKKTDTAGKAIEGVEFKLLNENQAEVLKFVTTKDGYQSSELVTGKYFLVESKAKTNYILDSSAKEIIITANETNSSYFDQPLVNEKQKVRIQIEKKGEGNALLSGVTFDISQGGKLVASIITDNKGIAVSEPLAQGDYTISEKKQPPGYVKANNIELKLQGDDSGKPVLTKEIEIINEKTITEIAKKDAVNGKELPGASLKLIEKESNKLIESWISTDKPHIIRGLEQGKSYILTEDLAPLGYALAQSIEFKIDGSGVKNKVEMVNHLTTTEISKKDAVKGEELPGASLKLIEKESNKLIESWISTDKPHIIRGLEQGKSYILTEDLAPLGYALAQSIEFKIDVSGVKNKVEMVNDLTTTEISKKDAVKGEELPGASLKLIEKESNKLIESWISTDKPHIIRGLEQGKSYILTEDLAPLGYSLAQSIEFTVDGAHSVMNRVEMVNDLTTTVISKKDAVKGEELPGAVLTITAKDTDELIDIWTSTAEPHIIKGLEQGKSYVLTEDLAPLGYSLAQSIEFTVDGSHGVKNKVEMVNELTRTEIIKVDGITGKALSGAKLQLKEKDSGQIIADWTSGPKAHVLTGLKAGSTYIISELTAPDGYEKMVDLEIQIKGDNGYINEIILINELFPKTGEEGVSSLGFLLLAISSVAFLSKRLFLKI